MYLRNFIESLLDQNEAEKFAEFAFGEDFRIINLNSRGYLCWNERHKDKLELQPNGLPSEDIPKMIEIWKKYESKPS